MSRNRKAGRSSNRPAVVSNDHHESHAHIVQGRAELRVGPIPDAEELARYDAVVPGGADRIMRAWEDQSEHRRAIEKVVIIGDNRRAYLGMAGGFVLQTLVICGSVYLGIRGHEWPAVALAGGGSVTGLSTVWASWHRSKERAGRTS